jgi:hypothetical protein
MTRVRKGYRVAVKKKWGETVMTHLTALWGETFLKRNKLSRKSQ